MITHSYGWDTKQRLDADVINYIIQQHDAGVIFREIADRLNDQGIKTTMGHRWNTQSVASRYYYWKPGDR